VQELQGKVMMVVCVHQEVLVVEVEAGLVQWVLMVVLLQTQQAVLVAMVLLHLLQAHLSHMLAVVVVEVTFLMEVLLQVEQVVVEQVHHKVLQMILLQGLQIQEAEVVAVVEVMLME
jgi:hypothetical protein